MQFLDKGESRGDLCKDYSVEDERSSLSGACELLLRPGKPARVLGEEVKQDAAVDERLQVRAAQRRVRARISSVVISP